MVVKLMGFDFEIQYKPGLENKAVDALSRMDSTAALLAMTLPHVVQLENVDAQVLADERLRAIVVDLQ